MSFTHINGAGVGISPHSTWLRKCFDRQDNFFGSEVNQYMATYLLKLFDVPLDPGSDGKLCFETW
jgi:hypothetical protein